MSNIDEQLDPMESYVAPPRTFQGKELKSYSLGNKMLLGMITREGDPTSFFLFSLLYVLSHERAKVQKECADRDGVRLKVLEWLDGLNLEPATGKPLNDDKTPNPDYVASGQERAEDLAVQILQEANKEKVDPIASASAGNG